MNVYRYWPELLAVSLMVVGFIFAMSMIGSLFMAMVLIFLWGMVFGRLWYKMKGTFRFPWMIVIVGFLVGYLLASLSMGYTNILVLIALYFVGMWFSYVLHDKDVIESI
ncbi:hypothetical protein H6504_02780 [Candidatus Woesearchaeota archaeon]|nr:hypothetical protein [Candidatus Woesearchaeota archaeon]